MKKELIIEKSNTCFTEYILVRVIGKKRKVYFKFNNSFLGIVKLKKLVKSGKIQESEGANLMRQIYVLPIPVVKCRIWNEFHRVQKTHEYLRKCLNIIKKLEDKIFKQITEIHMLSMN